MSTLVQTALLYPMVLTDRRIAEARFTTPKSPAPAMPSKSEWAPVTAPWSWSGFGALEFYDKRLVNGIEVYTPLDRPLDRYLCEMNLYGEPSFTYRYPPTKNQKVTAEVPVIQGVLVEVLVKVEDRFGPNCPLHIGKPFEEDDWFLEQFLKLVQDNKRTWQHEHHDFGAKQAGSSQTYERKFWWMQGPEERKAIHERASYTYDGDKHPTWLDARAEINSGDVLQRILTSVPRSLSAISLPLRTCYSEKNVAVPVHFDVISILDCEDSEDQSGLRYKPFPKAKREKVKTYIWNDETFRWVLSDKLRMLSQFGKRVSLPIFTPVESAEFVIPEKEQTVIRPEDFMHAVAAERQHQKIERLCADYRFPQIDQVLTPALEQKWQDKLDEETDKLLARAHLQTPCGHCEECLSAKRNGVAAFETCVCIERYSSGFYGNYLGYVPGSGATYYDPLSETERREKGFDRREQSQSVLAWLLDGNNDESAESVWQRNLNNGDDWIDDGNQRETTHGPDPSELKRQVLQDVRPFFPNATTSAEARERIKDLSPDELRVFDDLKKDLWREAYNRTNREFFENETGTTFTDAQLKATIEKSRRDSLKADEYMTLKEATELDPEFSLALQNWLPTVEIGCKTEGWYTVLNLNNRWMLYYLCKEAKRIRVPFTSPEFSKYGGIGIEKDSRMAALTDLWLKKVKQARDNAKGKAAKDAAERHIIEAFERADKRDFYRLPNLPDLPK